MKLIIDIPEEEYELIVNDEACGLNRLTRAIANGIPLDGVLQEIRKEICDMYPNYTDEKGYRMIRKSDVLNIIDKHIKEIEE